MRAMVLLILALVLLGARERPPLAMILLLLLFGVPALAVVAPRGLMCGRCDDHRFWRPLLF